MINKCLIFALIGYYLSSSSTPVQAILCYQCADLKGETNCQTNFELLANASLLLTKEFFQNCTESNHLWNKCMIERYWLSNELMTFHRGCHDGENFIRMFNESRFQGLKPNNLTTCAHLGDSGTHFACYQFCDTDFCNGPAKPENKTCNVTVSSAYYDEIEEEICAVKGLHYRPETVFLNLACLAVTILSVIGVHTVEVAL
ncbi:uncharacterized protein LOC106054451 [Biomphalaria glabrata]|uniref:Uncharacterized protein LOC106054451 n=1 Tax=Biomphalaria glabrata TaxID=6526 RepID=A0A9W2YQJ1_BIOGL|nr:uncharacterized protein LOC106054451 [Biomphalaria glabrata]